MAAAPSRVRGTVLVHEKRDTVAIQRTPSGGTRWPAESPSPSSSRAPAACSSKKDSPPPPSTCGTHAPVVAASADRTSVEPATAVQLTAASTDADDACLATPQPRSYRWRIESRPPTSTAVVSDSGVGRADALRPTCPAPISSRWWRPTRSGSSRRWRSRPSRQRVQPPRAHGVAVRSRLGDGVLPGHAAGARGVGRACLASGAVTYRWTLASRPAGSSAILSDPAAQRPALLPDVVGPYELALVVTSSVGLESPPRSPSWTSACAAPRLRCSCRSRPPPLAQRGGPRVGRARGADRGREPGNVRARHAVVRLPRPSSPGRPAAARCSRRRPAPTRASWRTRRTASTRSRSPSSTRSGNESAPAFVLVRTSSCGVTRPWPGPAGAGRRREHADWPLAGRCRRGQLGLPRELRDRGQRGRLDRRRTGPGSHPLPGTSSTATTASGATPPTFVASNGFQADVPGSHLVQAVAIAATGIRSAPAQAAILVSAAVPTRRRSRASPSRTRAAASSRGRRSARP